MNAFRFLSGVAGAFVMLFSTAAVRAQTDDFQDGNDTGWTRFAPLGPFGGTSFSVTGGKYTLTCQSSPNPAEFGPARCGSFQAGRIYSTFLVMVDISDFDPADDTSVGILARIQPNPAPGGVNGYSFTYQASDHDVQLSRIENEQPTGLGSLPAVTLETGKSYRMVFFGVGTYLEGRIYDLANPLVPVVTAIANDATFASGTCGVVVFADQNTRAMASFDNYAATDGTLPGPKIVETGEGFEVSWDMITGLPYTLSSSNDLEFWFPVTGVTFLDGRMRYFVRRDVEFPSRFFRLRLDPEAIIVAQ